MSRLQREIKQTKPFASAQQEAAIGLLRTAGVLRRFLARVLEPWGITPQQYNVLRILRGAGDGGLPILTIAERMIEETPGITRLFDRLEAKNLVTRERSQSDRRQVICQLTPVGVKLLESLDEPVFKADKLALGEMNQTEARELIRILDSIRLFHEGDEGKEV